MNSIVLILFSLCLVAGISSLPVKAPGQNFEDCEFKNGDVLLYITTVSYPSVLNEVITETVAYPESGTGTAIIHCVRANDNMTIEGPTGGTATIIVGGVNETYVELLLTSQTSEGLFFTIEIYGQ